MKMNDLTLEDPHPWDDILTARDQLITLVGERPDIRLCIGCGSLMTGDHNKGDRILEEAVSYFGKPSDDYCSECTRSGFTTIDHEPSDGPGTKGFVLGLCFELAGRGFIEWPHVQRADEERELILARGRKWIEEHAQITYPCTPMKHEWSKDCTICNCGKMSAPIMDLGGVNVGT